MTTPTVPEVFIIESLGTGDEDDRREGEVISRSLRMAGKSPIYRYIRTKKELEYFVAEFEESGYRYLHISCHGATGSFAMTLDDMTDNELADVVGPVLNKRRLFLSACLGTTTKFATHVFQRGGCISIAGPKGEIRFDDAVVLWTAFYHLMFKHNSASMNNTVIKRNLSIASLILDEKIRFFTPEEPNRTAVKTLLPQLKSKSVSLA